MFWPQCPLAWARVGHRWWPHRSALKVYNASFIELITCHMSSVTVHSTLVICHPSVHLISSVIHMCISFLLSSICASHLISFHLSSVIHLCITYLLICNPSSTCASHLISSHLPCIRNHVPRGGTTPHNYGPVRVRLWPIRHSLPQHFQGIGSELFFLWLRKVT